MGNIAKLNENIVKKEIIVRKNKTNGITLIALIIIVIILLILAGVVLNLTLGERGIFNVAKKAKENYVNVQDKELADLEKLYSEIKVATGENSQITISMEDLNKIIESKVNKGIQEKVTPLQEKVQELETKLTPRNLQESVNKATGGIIDTTTNLNDVKTAGMYAVPSSSYANINKNFPENNIGGIVAVYTVGTNSCVQIYYGYTGSSNFVHMWVRHYYLNLDTGNEYWSNWTQMHSGS